MKKEDEEAEHILKQTKKQILEQAEEEIKEAIKEDKLKELDITETIFSIVDENTPQENKEALNLIEYIGGTETIDKGLIDNSNINRQLITTAYAVLEQEICNDNLINSLQGLGEATKEEAENKLKQIQEELKEYKEVEEIKEDNKNQIKDFEPFYISERVLNKMLNEEDKKRILKTDAFIKVFSLRHENELNKGINYNALVFEGKKEKNKFKVKRIYVMEARENQDIREIKYYLTNGFNTITLMKYWGLELEELKQAIKEYNPITCLSPYRYTGKCLTCLINKRGLKEIEEVNCNPQIKEEELKKYKEIQAKKEAIKKEEKELNEYLGNNRW